MNPNGVSLEQVLSALTRKGIPLQFEMGTFVVLEATEKVLNMQAADRKGRPPVKVGPAAVWLSDDGEIALMDVAPASSEREACSALVELLGALLVRSAPGVPELLLELVEQGPSDGEWSLRRLRDDLEASLLPLNRGATRRVLSRLLREMRRDVERGGVAPAPDLKSVDRALDDLLGLDPGELPPAPKPTPVGVPKPAVSKPAAAARLSSGAKTAQLLPDDHEGDAIDATPLAQTVRPGPRAAQVAEPEIPSLREVTSAPRESARSRPERASARESRPDATPPAIRARANAREPITLSGESSPVYNDERDRRSGLDEFDSEASSGGRGGLKIALAFAAAAIGLVAAYLVVGRDTAQHALGIEQPAKPVAPEAQPSAAAAPQAAGKRYGTLHVTSTPDRAQVLMLVGTGPALIKDLPVGVAHEFVAIADGLSPARGLVPAGASWPLEAGSPRYELAVQLNDAPRGGFDLGPSRLSQPGSPNGTLGSVRVVTSPPGARVYQLIGFTPDVSVENLPVDAPIELLIYAPGYALQRASVGAGDWLPSGGGLAATVNVKLNKKGR